MLRGVRCATFLIHTATMTTSVRMTSDMAVSDADEDLVDIAAPLGATPPRRPTLKACFS